MTRTTESDSHYDVLESMSTEDLLININKEDKKVASFVEKAIPDIEILVDVICQKYHQEVDYFI